MPNVVPLIQVPLNAFMKAFDHNSSRLEKLRRTTAKRIDGYFLVKDSINIVNTFPLVGKYAGNWRLGRIRLTQQDPSYDYEVEIYRRSLDKTNTFGSVMAYKAKDDDDLANALRDLDKGMNIQGYPSSWDISHSDTFSKLEFDII